MTSAPALRVRVFPAEVSVSTLAWGAAFAIFWLARLGPTWQPPANGPELLHLAGAWQAAQGASDPRFVPTLFQALASLILRASESAAGPRALAFAATATVPAAVYLLRPRLGNAGALLSLLILALDAPAVALGAGASAMGFDIALAAWLFVLFDRPAVARQPAVAAAAGFAVATAGPLPATVAIARLVVALLAREPMPRGPAAMAAAAGAAAGILVASAGFGLGFDGLRIPPVDLFAAGFDERWSTASTLHLALIYSVPLLAAGGTSAALLARRAFCGQCEPFELLLLAWAAVAGALLLVSLGSHNPVAPVAAAMPLALILGPAVAGAVDRALEAPWQTAGLVIPAAALLLLVAGYFTLDWAKLERTGSAREVTIVIGLSITALAGLGFLASDRRTLPTLMIPASVAGLLFAIAVGSGVALSARQEPLLSPASTSQAPQLRALAAEHAAAGGSTALHPSLAAAATWPLRGAEYRVDAAPTDGATLAIWPAGTPAPAGMVPLEGSWALLEEVEPPGDLLDWLHWALDRNTLATERFPIAVYVRGSE